MQNYTINHSKNRTFIQVPITGDPNAINNIAAQVLQQEGYFLSQYNETGLNETVWKKGTGMATAMKYIKLLFQPNMLIISGWTCAGVGSVTVNEMPLNGFVGAIPKKSCMKSIEKVIAAIQSVPPQQNYVPQQPQQ